MAEEEEISKAEAMVEETQDVEEEEEAAGTTRAPNPNIPPANKKEYNFAPQSSGSSNYATLNSTKKVIIQEVQSEYDSGYNAAQSLKPSKRNIQ